jgi:hypothetical protein
MGRASRISFKIQFLELGNRDLKRLFDATKAGGPCPLLHARDLLQKVPPIRIVSSPDGAIGLAHKLRNDVKVANRTQKVGQVPIVAVYIDLFEICLRKARRVVQVVLIRSAKELHSVMGHALARDPGDLSIVLAEGQLVFPHRFPARDTDCYYYLDLWISSGRE